MLRYVVVMIMSEVFEKYLYSADMVITLISTHHCLGFMSGNDVWELPLGISR